MPRRDKTDFQHLLAHTHDAVVVLGEDDCILYANGAAEALFGQPTDSLVGRHVDLQAADTGHVVIHRGAGDDSHAEVRTIEVTWDGHRAHALLLADATGLHRAQQRLRQAVKMEAIGRLTASVAHDFNNMLTIINGFTRVALTQVDKDDPLHESLEEVARAAAHSAEMISELLTLARPQSPDLKPTRLKQLLTAMAPSLERLLGEHIDVTVELAPDVGSIRAEPVQFEQAVNNLATNARDAMEGRGKLVLSGENVHVSEADAAEHSAAAGEYVRLSITDNGFGMDEAVCKQIFEPFFTTKSSGKGTGLGLAMVNSFMVGNDGHIRVESSPGLGMTFHLYFPRAADAAESETDTAVPASSYESERANGEVILIAEDEPAVRNLLIRVLQTCGYDVIAGSDGAEALRKAQDYQGHIDLLITDVVMPNTCGRTLAEKMRGIRPKTKVIYISGYAQGIIDADTAAREGALLIQKPFSPDHLLATVRQMLAAAESPAA